MSILDDMNGKQPDQATLDKREKMTALEMDIEAKIQALFPQRGVRMQHEHVQGFSVGHIKTTEGDFIINAFHQSVEDGFGICLAYKGQDE